MLRKKRQNNIINKIEADGKEFGDKKGIKKGISIFTQIYIKVKIVTWEKYKNILEKVESRN